ncbi:MAG: hypothetical protein PHQ52_07250 [Candidatus Omnitrophica bacterium]|nr:hypothetical protein [Candidatus Omnitrophota bacterium]
MSLIIGTTIPVSQCVSSLAGSTAPCRYSVKGTKLANNGSGVETFAQPS